jgi:HEAT repeat protein
MKLRYPLSLIALAAAFLAACAQNKPAETPTATPAAAVDVDRPAVEAEARAAKPSGFPAIEKRMIAVISAPGATADARNSACRILRIVGSARCVPAVAALLTDEQCSHMARYALEPNTSAAAGDALRAALGTTKGRLQAGIISSIAMRRDAKAVPALAPLASDADADVATAAIQALGEIGTIEAAKALNTAQVADGLKIRQTNALIVCARQLANAGMTQDAMAIYTPLLAADQPKTIRIAALQGQVGLLDRGAAIKLITDTLQSDDAAIRAGALAAYSASKDAQLKNAVVQQLPSLNADAQILLLGALADQSDVSARPVLLQLLEKKDEQVRTATCGALVRHGEAADVPDLVKLAAAEGPDGPARKTLERMGKPGVDEALVDLIAQPDANARAVVVSVLGVRRVESALPALVKLLGGTDAATAASAAKALESVGTPAQLPALAEVLASTADADLRTAAEAAARFICIRAADKSACAGPLLAALQKAKSAPARISFIKLLSFTRSPQALAAVRAATADSDAQVKDIAIRTMIDWPEISAAPDLVNFAKSSTDQTYTILALQGCLRLARTPGANTVDRLALYRSVLELAKRPDEKRQALAGLADVPAAAALDMIAPYFSDAAVSEAAVAATIRLARQVAVLDGKKTLASLQQAKESTKDDDQLAQIDAAVKAAQTAGQNPDGFITAWLLSGPYLQEGKARAELFDMAFAPESGTATDWRIVTTATRGTPLVNLGTAIGGNERVAYIRCSIVSPSEQEAVLEIGSDDGCKVWLNKQVVLEKNVVRPLRAGEDKVRVNLKSGANELLVKVTQGGNDWSACVRMTTPDGRPLSGLRISLEQ